MCCKLAMKAVVLVRLWTKFFFLNTDVKARFTSHFLAMRILYLCVSGMVISLRKGSFNNLQIDFQSSPMGVRWFTVLLKKFICKSFNVPEKKVDHTMTLEVTFFFLYLKSPKNDNL